MHCNKKRGAQKTFLDRMGSTKNFHVCSFFVVFFSKESDNRIRKSFPIYLKQYTFDILDK